MARAFKAEPHRDEILELYASCRGNLVRVHEELVQRGATLSYQALTAFCRKASIGHQPALPVGQYSFAPGQEMQHDTSLHRVLLSGKQQRVQTASLVLCYSRMLFFQHYPTFNRFYCKVFLTDALSYLGGACRICEIDNTHVVVQAGSGKTMVTAPEMEAFAERFGFVFQAHEIGHCDRKARVERSMSTIENNFLAGRSFADFADLNRQAVAWCDKVNGRFKRHLHAVPRELFALERVHMRALPIHVPEVYQLHHRLVDAEGYVTLSRHRYSVPFGLIGRQLEVRESRDRLEVYDGPRRVAAHQRVMSLAPTKVGLREHRPARRLKQESPETSTLAGLQPFGQKVVSYAQALRKRWPGLRGTLMLRRLSSFCRDYPRRAVEKAVERAGLYGLYDMDRLEPLILKAIQSEYFLLPEGPDEEI